MAPILPGVQRQQPSQGGVAPNWDNRLTHGLVLLVHLGNSGPTGYTWDSVQGKPWTPSGTLARNMQAQGAAVQFTGGTNGQLQCSASLNTLLGTNDHTVMLFAGNTNLSRNGVFLSGGATSGPYINCNGKWTHSDVATSLSNAPSDGTMEVCFFQQAAGKKQVFQNGLAGTAVSSIAASFSAGSTTIGNYGANGGFSPDGSVVLIAVWKKVLPLAAIKSLTANPWQLFAQTKRRLWAPSAAVVSNLSVSQALPDAVLSATAAAVVSTSVSQALPDAALSATVAARDSLSSSQAVPDATLVATAAARAGLSSSQAVPDAALSATATVRVALSSSQTLLDAALVATAAVRDSLSSTQTIPDAALVATASAPASLSSTQSVPDAALSAAMTARTGLSVAQAVPDAVLVAAAAVRVSAGVTQLVPDAALAAAAAAQVAVRATQAVPDAALSAHAGVVVAVSATQLVPDATLTATATAARAGQHVPDAVLVARISHVYPLLRPTPTERTLVIPARSRTLVVAAQRRVLDIPAQNRTLKCS